MEINDMGLIEAKLSGVSVDYDGLKFDNFHSLKNYYQINFEELSFF